MSDQDRPLRSDPTHQINNHISSINHILHQSLQTPHLISSFTSLPTPHINQSPHTPHITSNTSHQSHFINHPHLHQSLHTPHLISLTSSRPTTHINQSPHIPHITSNTSHQSHLFNQSHLLLSLSIHLAHHLWTSECMVFLCISLHLALLKGGDLKPRAP